jgi:hypothetical protein
MRSIDETSEFEVWYQKNRNATPISTAAFFELKSRVNWEKLNAITVTRMMTKGTLMLLNDRLVFLPGRVNIMPWVRLFGVAIIAFIVLVASGVYVGDVTTVHYILGTMLGLGFYSRAMRLSKQHGLIGNPQKILEAAMDKKAFSLETRAIAGVCLYPKGDTRGLVLHLLEVEFVDRDGSKEAALIGCRIPPKMTPEAVRDFTQTENRWGILPSPQIDFNIYYWEELIRGLMPASQQGGAPPAGEPPTASAVRL